MKSKINLKKYSRKNNKKIKCSRKMMKGGSFRSSFNNMGKSMSKRNKSMPSNFLINSEKYPIYIPPHNKKKLELEDLYNCSIKRQENLGFFEKYEYEMKDDKSYEKMNSKYLYRKKNADKEINEVFNVYELTNTNIGIEYNKNKEKDKIGIFYEISLIDLNVDLIQLAINTNSLSISKDPNNGSSYLGFTNNFPALVYNNDRESFTYTSRTNAKWTTIYEDNTFDRDDIFEITNSNPNYPHPSHTPKFSEQNKITNQDLYMQKYTEIKDRLLSGDDIKDLLEQDIFRMRVKVECENDESLADLAKLDFIISQNINWVLKNALWLEKYLEIRTVDNSLKAKQLLTLIGKKYECDLSNLDEHYIIVDEMTIDGIKYVICGYPEKKMKEIILNFWQENVDTSNETDIFFYNELKKLHKLKETLKLLIDFYNFKEPLSSKNIKDNTKELYKFFSTKIDARFKNISKLFTEFYENNKILKDEKEYKNFIENYLENAQNYYNEIAKQYFDKIMTTIRYIFIVFIKNVDDTLRPMIFNIKEFEKKHIPILERLNKLVKNELPYKFGIIEDEYKSEYKYNPISSYDNKEEYNSNNEYKLFYSSYKYGNFFHINTEYIHTMGNIYRKDYEYKQSITLEEIIYACNVNSEINSLISYWKAVKLNYNVREYDLSFPSLKQIKSRSDIVYDKYEADIKSKEVLSDKKITINKSFDKIFDEIFNNKNLKNSKIKIIMIYKINIQSYKIILKYTNNENIDEIYILEIESSITELIDNIINKLYDNIILNKISKIITFNDSDRPIFFKVISIDVITEKDYKKIFTYNPIILYYINQHKRTNSIKKEIFQNNLNKLIPKNTQLNNIDNNIMNKVLNTYNKTQNDIIDTSIYYMNAMLNVNNIKILSYLINLYNIEIYKIYPWIVKNFLEDKYYNDAENYKNNLYCNNRLYYSNKFTGCDTKMCDDSYINCVYYNINNCGYDFIETIDNQLNKIVIYIIPSNLNTTNQTHKFLSNINDVDFNSKQMIFELDKLYLSKNSIIYTHTFPNIIYFCLHFHIINTDNYKREKHFTEKGTYIIQDIFTTDIIKNLNTNSNYYRNSNYSVIRQQ